jgi:hypothetical protein
LHWVYVDEAGDRGMKAASSDHFVVSAVVVRDVDHSQVRSELAALRQALGRDPGHVVHFRKLTHPQKIKAAQDVAASSIAVLTNVIVCKRHLQGTNPLGGGAPFIFRADPMYLWALRLLLERISWYIRDHGGGSSIVTFAHLKGFHTQKLHNYRAALAASPTNIDWPSFDGHLFRFGGMQAVELLQLADLTASALYGAVEPDQYGNREERYLHILSSKLYRYFASPVTSYGLKVFPSSQANPGGSLHWLQSV